MATKLKRVLAINANTEELVECEVIDDYQVSGTTYLLVRQHGKEEVESIPVSQVREVLEYDSTESQIEKVKEVWGELFAGLIPGLGGRNTDEDDESEDITEEASRSVQEEVETEEFRESEAPKSKEAKELEEMMKKEPAPAEQLKIDLDQVNWEQVRSKLLSKSKETQKSEDEAIKEKVAEILARFTKGERSVKIVQDILSL